MPPAIGQDEVLGKEQFAVDVFQVRLQLGQMPVKNDRLVGWAHAKPALVAPAHQPLQQFQAGHNQRFPQPFRVRVGFGEPLDELPILKGKKLLLVRRPARQINHFGQGLDSFAGAMARDEKSHREGVQGRMLVNRRRRANDADAGPGRVQMGR